jgi:excisionase family DNA binding protein
MIRVNPPPTPAERYNRAVEAAALREDLSRPRPDPALELSPLGYTTHQAASALGVSAGTIRRWADAGALESLRTPGGHRRFSREQLDQFIASLRESRGDSNVGS